MYDLLRDHSIDVIVLATLVGAAIWTVLSPRLLRAVIALALVSVCITIALFRLDAPIAGVFELSVCAGLVSAVFISTISLTQVDTDDSVLAARRERVRRYWYLPPLLLLVGITVFQLELPEFPKLVNVGKDVRQVLWTERHLDLLGQITVLLAGAFGVVVLFKETKKHER